MDITGVQFDGCDERDGGYGMDPVNLFGHFWGVSLD